MNHANNKIKLQAVKELTNLLDLCLETFRGSTHHQSGIYLQ